MSIYLALIGAVMMTAAVLAYRQQRSRKQSFIPLTPVGGRAPLTPPAAAQLENKPNFQGFNIEPGDGCCQAAAELQNITFSYRDNLSLPLPGCDKQICTCRRAVAGERRKWDRRSTLDRRGEVRFTTGVVDRRAGKGRRTQDKIWSGGYVH